MARKTSVASRARRAGRSSASRFNLDARKILWQLPGQQIVDLPRLRLKNEGAPRINTIVDPMLGPAGCGGKALLRKLRQTKALLLLKAARYENIHIRLHDGIARIRCRRTLRPADIDPSLSIGFRRKLPFKRLDVRDCNARAAIQNFAPIRCDELRRIDVIDHRVEMAFPVRQDPQICRAKTCAFRSREPTAPETLDLYRMRWVRIR